MIGIIAAMEDEMSILKEALNCDEYEKICGINFHIGFINDEECILTSSGIGKVNSSIAATILINHFGCDLIINTGIAGGINGVDTKDIVLAKNLMYYDVDVTGFGYEYGQVPQMPKLYFPSFPVVVSLKKILTDLNLDYKEATIYSGDSFVTSLDFLSKVDTSIPSIVEMEGTSIAQVCVKAGVDFVVIRYVSDIVGKENQIADYKEFEFEMANRSAKICLEILKKLA